MINSLPYSTVTRLGATDKGMGEEGKRTRGEGSEERPRDAFYAVIHL